MMETYSMYYAYLTTLVLCEENAAFESLKKIRDTKNCPFYGTMADFIEKEGYKWFKVIEPKDRDITLWVYEKLY